MSHIQDDVQIIKSCIKYIDEDKIVDFLNSIEFEFDDSDVDNYILQTSNTKLIEFCVASNLDDGYIENLLDMVDNSVVSDTALTIIKNKLVKQEDPDIIYQILNSNLVTWNNNPFTSGFFDGDYKSSVSDESILNQEEVYALFSIYAKHENWLENFNVNWYVKDKESLIAYLEEDNYDFYSRGVCDIDYVIDVAGEDFVEDYFDGDMPNTVDTATFADILIKCGIYH